MLYTHQPEGLRPAAYGECLFDALPRGSETRGTFATERLVCLKEITREDGGLDVILLPGESEANGALGLAGAIPLGHAADLPSCNSKACPPRELKRLEQRVRARFEHVKIGVVVIVEDADGRVLLTQRPSKMRIFPRAWVLPGGAVDAGESLAQAGAREVLEETGLSVDAEALVLVGLWESAFPTTAEECLARGVQSGHHLVVYYRGRVKGDSPQLKLCPDEVDAAVWVDRVTLQRALGHLGPEALIEAVESDGTAAARHVSSSHLDRYVGLGGG